MSQFDPSQQSQWRNLNASIQTEWQQPPAQPLAQQPLYQQSFQSSRPPKKKARYSLWITVGAGVALIAILSIVFVGHHTSPQPVRPTPSSASGHRQQQPTQVANKPTPTLQPTLVINAIGKAVVVDSTWTVTVNSVKTSAGDPFSMPAAGNTFLMVDVTVKNISKHYQDMASGLQLVLKDSAGRQFMETITDFTTPPDGSIKFGEFLRGQVAYEIPATEHTFSYYFQADAGGTDLTEWALKV